MAHNHHATSASVDAMLNWIDRQPQAMAQRLTAWSAINTGSRNLAGLDAQATQVIEAAAPLGAAVERVSLPAWQTVDERGEAVSLRMGDALVLRKRPNAAVRVLLAIHMDTVFGPDHAFQTPRLLNERTLQGPGVADAKGGLLVLLTALEALERSGAADGLGWQVILNSDEELGSPASTPLLAAAAKQHDVGLVFEPTLPDGVLIGERGGSGNFTLVVRGRAAHVGRAFNVGRNAIHALAELIQQLAAMNGVVPGLIVNVGRIVGGGPVNVVPALAVAGVNVRVASAAAQHIFEQTLAAAIGQLDQREGYEVALHGGFTAPIKPLDDATNILLTQLADCGRELGMDLTWRRSAGVCDGNRLAAAGLPTVDTLGPRGGDIHSEREHVLLDSLPERARLTALLLWRYAVGGITPPQRKGSRTC